MKKLILAIVGLLLVSGAAWCASQYNAIGSVQMTTSTVNGQLGLTGFNKAQLATLPPDRAFAVVGCTDCPYGTICVSTGTGLGAWVSVSSGTAATGSSCD